MVDFSVSQGTKHFLKKNGEVYHRTVIRTRRWCNIRPTRGTRIGSPSPPAADRFRAVQKESW